MSFVLENSQKVIIYKCNAFLSEKETDRIVFQLYSATKYYLYEIKFTCKCINLNLMKMISKLFLS